MRSKGQGSLEYLLIIGAAIAVAGMVVFYLLNQPGTMTCENHKSVVYTACHSKPTESQCETMGDIDTGMELDGNPNECHWDIDTALCEVRAGLPWANSEHC